MKTLDDEKHHKVIAEFWHCLIQEYERDPSPSTSAIVGRYRQPAPSLELDWLKVCDLTKNVGVLSEMILTAHGHQGKPL